jgi:hypothetical protein
MSFRSPPFFLLVDSWLELAGGAGVVEVAAGCVAVESVEASAGAPVAAGEAFGLEEAAGEGKAFALPGVTVCTVAELPMLEVVAPGTLGCKENPIVSSPLSLAGVMVGGPLRAAAETSGPFLRMPMDRFMIPGRAADCSFCIRAIAVGSAGGTGMPNLTSLFFASPASEESG